MHMLDLLAEIGYDMVKLCVSNVSVYSQSINRFGLNFFIEGIMCIQCCNLFQKVKKKFIRVKPMINLSVITNLCWTFLQILLIMVITE